MLLTSNAIAAPAELHGASIPNLVLRASCQDLLGPALLSTERFCLGNGLQPRFSDHRHAAHADLRFCLLVLEHLRQSRFHKQ